MVEGRNEAGVALPEDLGELVDTILDEFVPDGGFECERDGGSGGHNGRQLEEVADEHELMRVKGEGEG